MAEAEFTTELQEKRGGVVGGDGGKAQSHISDWQWKRATLGMLMLEGG